jgi:hypothetical protein
MNEQDKEYMRDLAALFAMNGLLHQENYEANTLAELAYHIADAMMEAREPKETIGLPAIKRKARAK